MESRKNNWGELGLLGGLEDGTEYKSMGISEWKIWSASFCLSGSDSGMLFINVVNSVTLREGLVLLDGCFSEPYPDSEFSLFPFFQAAISTSLISISILSSVSASLFTAWIKNKNNN